MCRYGIWNSYDQYGLEVQYFRYSEMISYDNSIFNISAMIFSTLVYRYRVFEPFWGILSCKTWENLLYRVGDRYSIWVLPRDYDMENGNFWLKRNSTPKQLNWANVLIWYLWRYKTISLSAKIHKAPISWQPPHIFYKMILLILELIGQWSQIDLGII